MTKDYTVRAGWALAVTNYTDEDTEGTLRYALSHAIAGDVILIVEPGQTIALASPLTINKSLTIEGNGVTIIPGESWTGTSRLMSVSSIRTEATIRRVWFKDGSRGAISNGENLTLESCIFSGNYASNGGAICNNGGAVLNVKGSTFCNNSANIGGAIYCYNGGTVTLAGNLFYGNTADTSGPVVYTNNGTVTSLGYNVVDVTLSATNSATTSGFAGVTGDTTFADLSITDGPPFNATTFAPVPGLGAVINDSVWAAGNMPARDFNHGGRHGVLLSYWTAWRFSFRETPW